MIVTAVTEDQLQAQLWKWAWNTHPKARKCMWAVPNAAIGQIVSKKDMIQSQKMESTGLLKGVWDLHLFWHGKFHIIETKFGNNGLSKEQKEWRDIMVYHGAIPHIYYTIEEGIKIFESIIS